MYWQKRLVSVRRMVVGRYLERDRRKLSVPQEPIREWWGAWSAMARFEPCQLTYHQYVGCGHQFAFDILCSVGHIFCFMKLAVWSMHTNPSGQLVLEPKLRNYIQFVS